MLGKKLIIHLFALVIGLAACPLQAGENEKHYDRISLSASASQEVGNDLIIAVLFSQQEGGRPERLAHAVNQAIGSAIQQAKAYPLIKAQTLDYTTSPIYRKQQIDGWRVRQSIRLTSSDAAAVSELIGQLQKSLAVQSIRYNISPKLRQETENRLTVKAIAAFRERASLIAKQFDRNSYRLVDININSTGVEPRPMFRQEMAKMSSMAASPTLEAGTQKITVVVSGSVELQD